MGSLVYINKSDTFRASTGRINDWLSKNFPDQRTAKDIAENAFDLHVHSNRSPDAKLMAPQEIVECAKSSGLKGAAITDHNLFRDANVHSRLDRLFSKNGLIYVPGIELTLNTRVHILLLFSGYPGWVCEGVRNIRDILLKYELTMASILQLIDGNIPNTGEFQKAVVLAHPALKNPDKSEVVALIKEGAKTRKMRPVKPVDFANWRVRPFDRGRYVQPRGPFDAVDVQTQKCVDFAAEHKMLMIAGSDAHIPWMVGAGYTQIKTDSREELVEKILWGNFKEVKVRTKCEWWAQFRKENDYSPVPGLKANFRFCG